MGNKSIGAHFENANLADIVKYNCFHSSKELCDNILNTMLWDEDYFEGPLCDYHTKTVHPELKKDVVQNHHKAFSVPKIYEKTLKKELVDRLCKLEVLKHSISTWAVHTFITPKKNGIV